MEKKEKERGMQTKTKRKTGFGLNQWGEKLGAKKREEGRKETRKPQLLQERKIQDKLNTKTPLEKKAEYSKKKRHAKEKKTRREKRKMKDWNTKKKKPNKRKNSFYHPGSPVRGNAEIKEKKKTTQTEGKRKI